jgi:superfamily I DNA/RNA helicase
MPNVLDQALRARPDRRFDAIVVDEGQDLDSVWCLPLLDLLRDRERGIVYVFGDANQDLYHAREPSELGVVMPESPPLYYLNEDRRCTRSIHEFAARYSQTDTDAPPSLAVGPDGRRVEIFTYAEGAADACRRVLGTVLRRIIDGGKVGPADVVVLTPRSPRSSWLMSADGSPVEAWPYRLMPEYGPEGTVLPPPTRGNEVRVATIHRYKGLESPVVVLAEIDLRVRPEDLPPLLYVGATRAGRTSSSSPALRLRLAWELRRRSPSGRRWEEPFASARRTSHRSIKRQQRNLERFGHSDIPGVVAGEVGAQLPNARNAYGS